MKKILLSVLLIILSNFYYLNSYGDTKNGEYKEIFLGNKDAPVKIIVYSSLTCPHCANFHTNVLPLIKKNYVDTNKVNITLKDFPLDLVALNASKILQCVNQNQRLSFLDEVYEKQKYWIDGKDINEINNNLFDISNKYNLDKTKADECLKNPSLEEWVLNSRIDAQKKYDITSTPTIIINEKKFEDLLNFKNIEKKIKKII